MDLEEIRHRLMAAELVDDPGRNVHRPNIAMFAAIVKLFVADLAKDAIAESREDRGMENRGPDWLIAALADRPRGFQAEVARLADLSPDKLTKVLSGDRALKHHEGELLKRAIRSVEGRARAPEPDLPVPNPDQAPLIDRIVGRKPWAGRPAELVFLLESGKYVVFQLDPRRLDELEAAVQEMRAP